MNKRHNTPSATSLPVAPRTEADGRVRRYAITMTIRTVCFILMAVIQPMGWWTWVLAIGAVFLPYIAVVAANNPDPSDVANIESPDIAIEAPRETVADAAQQNPTVITIQESPQQKIAESPQHTDDAA